MRKPKIIAVYDNGGETVDRYTVYFNVNFNVSGTLKECLGMSSNPSHPQGFSQFSGGQLGPHNGKRTKFTDLPQHIQDHVNSRIN